ncbi:MAG: murein biosynthesis integral membrane protein MurJ [Microgenomates group bacterium]|nr:murein biosynthesis integral membrane protein MurJ [Microgenomates group bacterium]
MDKFLIKTKKLMFSQQGGIFSSALIMSIMIIVSRFFGFLRLRVLSSYFTANELDLYFASFRIPDIVFEILITGALTSAFVPIYIKYQNNKKDLWVNISSIINLLTLILFIFIFIIFIFLDKLVFLMTPGYSAEKSATIVYYSRILLLGQLPFLVIGNFLTAMGQANKSFLITSLAPIIYNLAVIFTTVLWAGKIHLFAPILGIVLGAFLFLLIQLPIPFIFNFQYLFIIRITEGLKHFFRMVIPRVFTVLTSQVDATIDLTLTTLISNGSYTIFYLAQHLQLLPISVIGISFGQASLPYLSEIYQNKKIDQLKNLIIDSILNLFFLTIPIASFFIFSRTPLVRLFFGGQKFDWQATVLTAYTISCFAISIPFHSIYYFLTRCFYALLDSRTPFYISLISIAINTFFSLIFILFFKLPVWSLALSFSIAISFSVISLFYILSRRLINLNFSFLIKETTKIVIITIIASLISYFSIKILDGLIFDTSRTINVFFLLSTVAIIYLFVYLFLAWLINIKELYLISKLLIKTKEYKNKILAIYSTYD